MVLFVILVLPKNYLADNENYLADSGARNGLCRAQPNFRASECRVELVRAMQSAAENVKK